MVIICFLDKCCNIEKQSQVVYEHSYSGFQKDYFQITVDFYPKLEQIKFCSHGIRLSEAKGIKVPRNWPDW